MVAAATGFKLVMMVLTPLLAVKIINDNKIIDENNILDCIVSY